MLAEDIGQGDVTSGILIPAQLNVEAEIIAKEAGLVAGVEEVTILAQILGLRIVNVISDGNKFAKNQVILKIFGDAQHILSVERTILNLLSRMSGIATATNSLIKKLIEAKLKTRIAATRKTVPGLNYFDKKAVFIGGGDTHRMNLADMILIKDNHIKLAGNLQNAIAKVKNRVSFSKKIEVEVTKISDVLLAASAGVDIIMLDNFSPEKISKAINLLKKEGWFGKLLLEASGGINFENLLDYASTKVDIISLGAITHSVKSLDMALKIVNKNKLG
ncbi:MAG: carboxylating nicotinate-nucleotide diphosphorylase [Candidatus Bathyarchaeota archaeon]|nr:carboxylating nicotinate-nucleotide diphosphorylase [Candidatus Bathyarchaeota archaeon]